MKNRQEINPPSDRLRWVVSLLVIAVILPTVCLLWFMTQAVKNERFAVRQKLMNIYQEQMAGVEGKNNKAWLEKMKDLEETPAGTTPYELFDGLVSQKGYDGLIIYDDAGKCIYPLLSAGISASVESAEGFVEAWRLEFKEQNFVQAAKIYEEKTSSYNNTVRFKALIGWSRCLSKLGRLDDAIDVCKQAAFSPLENQAGQAELVLIANARLLLLKFLESNEKYTSLFKETFEKLISMVYITNEAGASLPADYNLFLAQKLAAMLKTNSLLKNENVPSMERVHRLIDAEERSIDAVRRYPSAATLVDWQPDQVRALRTNADGVYGFYHKTADKTLLLLLGRENASLSLGDYRSNFQTAEVTLRLLDEFDSFVAGDEKPAGVPFTKAPFGRFSPDWQVELYLTGSSTFEKAASRQVFIYIWAGVLVIVLILAAGGFAGQVVGRQIKLNKLKNDFIATVSHELKTPLSSMRVLVDTLLEGNYKEQTQATEYLQLISKENARLSRMIDNFLTFSRMERNKQAFEIAPVSPVEIANAAVEAMTTRFEQGKVQFNLKVLKPLPMINADKDAMVTVLVNLLDNAYKYSDDDKKIELKVSAEDDKVCFSVKDNGIGMTRRQIRKIFDRFYQADRSLARSTGGTGLGLSIVKFIVDAHKGRIDVESKPEKGSEFKVLIARA